MVSIVSVLIVSTVNCLSMPHHYGTEANAMIFMKTNPLICKHFE